MKYIGTVITVSPKGELIVRSKTVPELGTHVIDKSRRQLGIVTNIFGPVNNPYISIKLLKRGRAMLNPVGIEVYLR